MALPILGDSDQLHQLFTNLLDNAIKYTPAGSQVTFEAIHNADQIQVTVADSGIGIVAEHLPHLFSRFYRTDAARARTSGGFGLGLAISRAIVQMHGGEIHVESTIDRGTTFIINFPKA
ncbi:MAG: ATP-binding protein [Caldilineaceae bacterium]